MNVEEYRSKYNNEIPEEEEITTTEVELQEETAENQEDIKVSVENEESTNA